MATKEELEALIKKQGKPKFDKTPMELDKDSPLSKMYGSAISGDTGGKSYKQILEERKNQIYPGGFVPQDPVEDTEEAEEVEEVEEEPEPEALVESTIEESLDAFAEEEPKEEPVETKDTPEIFPELSMEDLPIGFDVEPQVSAEEEISEALEEHGIERDEMKTPFALIKKGVFSFLIVCKKIIEDKKGNLIFVTDVGSPNAISNKKNDVSRVVVFDGEKYFIANLFFTGIIFNDNDSNYMATIKLVE